MMRPRHPRRRLLVALCLALAASCAGSREYESAVNEGRVLYNKGRHRLAADRLRAAVRLEPDEAMPRLYLARAQIRLGRLDAARNHLIHLHDDIGLDALEDPADRLALLLDLGAFGLRGAMDRADTASAFKARDFFERALSLAPDNPSALLGKALALYSLDRIYEPGNDDAACDLLQDYLARRPGCPEALYYLARCNEKDRRLSTVKAVRLYEEILEGFGDPDARETAPPGKGSLFEVPVETVDRNVALRALERLVPLLSRMPPDALGLDGVTLRKKAKKRLELYNALGGKKAFPRPVLDWIKGVASSAASAPATGPSSGNGSAPTREHSGIRPTLERLAPEADTVQTGKRTLLLSARITDDAGGFTLDITVNGDPVSPQFSDVRTDTADVQGREGVRRTLSFRVDLREGTNEVLLKAVDRDGLTSEPSKLEIVFRPPALFAVAAGFNGPGDRDALRFAESDARDFLRHLSSRFALPPGNRTLLIGKDATAKAFRKACRDAASSTWEDDVIAIYFAGFGASLEGVRGLERYLVFHGFQPGRPAAGGVPLSELGELLGETRARRVTVILDTGFGPRDDGGARTLPACPGPPDSWAERAEQLLHPPDTLAGRLALVMAADGTGTAREIDPENPAWRSGGLLTTFLLEAFGKKKSARTPVELRAFLLPRVSYHAARAGGSQSPVVKGPEGEPVLSLAKEKR